MELYSLELVPQVTPATASHWKFTVSLVHDSILFSDPEHPTFLKIVGTRMVFANASTATASELTKLYMVLTNELYCCP